MRQGASSRRDILTVATGDPCRYIDSGREKRLEESQMRRFSLRDTVGWPEISARTAGCGCEYQLLRETFNTCKEIRKVTKIKIEENTKIRF
jgi:hypothetical protein